MRRGVRPGLAHAGVAVRGPVADGREGPALVAGPVRINFIHRPSLALPYALVVAQKNTNDSPEKLLDVKQIYIES